MKREDMKSFNELMNLFGHESLIEEEIILMGIERYTSFMGEKQQRNYTVFPKDCHRRQALWLL